MAREYFCAYHSYLKSVEPLNDAERGRLFTALLVYSETGETLDLRGNERFIFPTMKVQIDRDADKYRNFCQKQSESGKKGGRPKKPTLLEESQKTQPFFEKPKKAKEKEKEKENNIPPLPPVGDVFKAYAGDNAALLDALNDFSKMRTRIKKPLTDRAKSRLCTRLDTLAGNGFDRIALLDEAIERCWLTVYAPDNGRNGGGTDGIPEL